MVAVQRAGRRAAGAIAVGTFAWWIVADGGYAPGTWYPGALLLLGALVAAARPSAYRTLPSPTRWAIAALAAYAVWSFCSIAWADARGDAWDGANRTLLYLTVFALFAAVPWTTGEAATGLAALALAIAGVGLWDFAQALTGTDVTVFSDGRLTAPIGYENASAALFLLGFWGAVLLAVRRGTPTTARALLLAAAGVLAHLTVLAQSRGSLVAGVMTLAAAFAVVAERRRLILALAALVVTTVASLPALLGVYDRSAATGTDLVPAAVAIGLSAAVLLAVGLGLDRLERWLLRRRHTSRPRLVAAAVAALAATGAGFALAGGPLTASGGAAAGALDSRFAAGAGTGRYDLWRVAMLEFARNPVGGVGADNFAHDYARDGRGHEEPLYPHSLVLRAFSQTGLVGGALLVTFLVASGLAVLGTRGDAVRGSLAAAAGVAASSWVVQGSIDWLWELPAVAGPALACLGLAAGLGSRRARRSDSGSGRRRIGVLATAALLAPAAGASYALPALAARDIERAVGEFAGDPGAALRRLERAHRLNPLTDRADLVAGALKRASGDREGARRALLQALARDDRNWHPHVELALLDLQAGRRAAALSRLELAERLRPGESLIAASRETARSGRPPSRALLDAVAAETLPGPLGRRAVGCAPDLGLATSCGPGASR